MSPSRSVWFAFALGLMGCGQLWKPFLEPTPDTCTGLLDCLQPIICADGSCTGGQDAGPGDAQPTGMDWVPQTSPTTADLFAVWVASRQVAYAGGSGGVTLSINQANGRGWQPAGAPPTSTIRSIYGTSLASIWFLGDLGQGLRRTSANWIVANPCDLSCSNNFLGVWAKDDFSAITVGSSSAAYTHNNQYWSPVTAALLPSTNLTAVSGLLSGEVYIASDTNGILYRKTGGTYTQIFGPSTTTRQRRAIWAVSSTEVWLAGDRGEVDVFDGGSISVRPVPTMLAAGVRINGLTGNSLGDLWAVGDSGLILHRLPNGTWQREPSHVATNLFAVSVPADSDQPTIVGGRGTILQRQPVP